MKENFKKTINISGRFKMMTADGGKFFNQDGEEVQVATLIQEAMGTTPFDLNVSTKTEEEI
jgi:hypothetical protein